MLKRDELRCELTRANQELETFGDMSIDQYQQMSRNGAGIWASSYKVA